MDAPGLVSEATRSDHCAGSYSGDHRWRGKQSADDDDNSTRPSHWVHLTSPIHQYICHCLAIDIVGKTTDFKHARHERAAEIVGTGRRAPSPGNHHWRSSTSTDAYYSGARASAAEYASTSATTVDMWCTEQPLWL